MRSTNESPAQRSDLFSTFAILIIVFIGAFKLWFSLLRDGKPVVDSYGKALWKGKREGETFLKGFPFARLPTTIERTDYFLIAFSKRPRTSAGAPTPSMVMSLPFLPYQSMRGSVDLR
jgi:hypothetical protein